MAKLLETEKSRCDISSCEPGRPGPRESAPAADELTFCTETKECHFLLCFNVFHVCFRVDLDLILDLNAYASSQDLRYVRARRDHTDNLCCGNVD